MIFEAILGSTDGIGMSTETRSSAPMAFTAGSGAGMNSPAESTQFIMESARLREIARQTSM